MLSVVHDLSLARRCGSHAILLNHGKSEAAGKIEDVLTPANLDRVYDMDVSAWMRDLLAQWT